MKKVLAFVLVAALVLSIGVTAFADNSPVVRDYTRVTADGSTPAPASTDESGLEVCNVKDEVIDVVPDSKVFAGWNTEADGSGTTVAVGSTEFEHGVLYAVWADEQDP